jgi:hypothetical protein
LPERLLPEVLLQEAQDGPQALVHEVTG